MKFRHTNFMRLIYATLLALPFVAILSRVIYVQSNKNAYQSAEITQTTYSRTPKYEQGDINEGLKEGKIYHIETYENSPSDITEGYISFKIINGVFASWPQTQIQVNDEGREVEPNHVIYTFDGDSETLNVYIVQDNLYYDLYYEQPLISLSADILIEEVTVYDTTYFSNTTYQDYNYIEVESTTLDNVFEYSVNKFIENNNFGKINLFQWTTNLFFDSNDVNNMYVGFINWYLNYTLLVSATYILFLVLMWFINYARRLLERGMNYDW